MLVDSTASTYCRSLSSYDKNNKNKNSNNNNNNNNSTILSEAAVLVEYEGSTVV